MISIVLYIIFLVFTLLYFLFFSVVFVLTLPFDRQRVVLHWLSRLWTKCYFGIVPTWRVTVEGRENIEPGKPYVVIVNHRSMIDILLMYVLPMNFKWVAKKQVYRWPIFGWVLWMHGDIAIERGTAGGVKKMIREADRWLRAGTSVVIFPEGSRSRTGQIQRFKEGAFMLAQKTGMPILPCVTVGTGDGFNGWRINFRNKYKVRILPPLSAEEVRSATTKELAARMQEVMTAEHEKLRKEN